MRINKTVVLALVASAVLYAFIADRDPELARLLLIGFMFGGR